MKTLRMVLPLVTAAIALHTFVVTAADWPQWRGPARDGISKDKGLLQEWPAAGPKLAWQVSDAGTGYSTPSVSGKTVFLLGNTGETNEFIQARDLKDGKILWQTRLGNVGNPKQDPSYPGARSTPTVDGNLVYALGSDGDLACLDKRSGKIRWQKSLRTDFGGKAGIWAYSESPLISGKALICTPGGPDATIVALHKATGDTLWKCAVPGEEEAAYGSPTETTAAGVRQFIQMLPKGLVGVDAASGKLLWRYTRTISRYKANIPSPLARGADVMSAGSGTGAALIRLKPGPEKGSVTYDEVYFSPKLPNHMSGIVVLNGHLYGTASIGLLCADWSTGAIKWEDRATGSAAICYADNRLYLHAENGDVFLVDPSTEGYKQRGRFSPPDQPKRISGQEKAWTHPIVANGRLLIRDHGMLWCYDVKSP